MSRPPVLILAFAATAAWAGAQHGTVDAYKHVEMLAKNRVTIGLLVDNGLDLADTDDAVVRVDKSRKAAEAVRLALADAADAQEVDRVVELGEHLSRLFSDGLVPTLRTAAESVHEGTPSMEELKSVRKRVARDAESAAVLDLLTGKLAGSGRVKDVSKKLNSAVEQVKAAVEPKK